MEVMSASAFGPNAQTVAAGRRPILRRRVLGGLALVACAAGAAALVVHSRGGGGGEPASSSSATAAVRQPVDDRTGHWWETGVMYQIYPRSFKDSNGDGMGDLKGIEQQLQYLNSLGVGFIWLSPVMESPMRDFGYDISNFTQIDPLFGTLQDMKDLLAAAGKLGIKIMMDFVPNHSSNESAWFKESRSSKTNPKRDWYIWNPGKLLPNGTRVPPNNWASNFGGGLGSSWTWDEATQEYYYHAFGEFQPDLNYRNSEVVKAMQDVLRFWLDLGVGGFRIDAVPFLLEDPELRDEVFDPVCTLPVWNCMQHTQTQNDPKNHDIIRGWRQTVDEFNESAIFGEIYADLKDLMKYYGTQDEPEFNVPFNFQVLGQSYGQPNDLRNATIVRAAIRDYSHEKPSWAQGNWVLGNHDNHRVMERVGNDTALTAAIYALFNLLPGTPTIYNGDEIAMTDLYIPYDKCQDPMCIKNPEQFAITGRDPERTPMQWNNGSQAGFSSNASTWLPVNPDYVAVNVEAQNHNASSPLSVMQRTLRYRPNDLALGNITHVAEDLSEELRHRLVAVQFTMGDSFALTVANLDTANPAVFDLLSLLSEDKREHPPATWLLLFSTSVRDFPQAHNPRKVTLAPGAVAVFAPGPRPGDDELVVA